MSDDRTAGDAFGDAIGDLVGTSDDVAHVLARLLDDCVQLTGADSAAVLVHDRDGHLTLLGATSHRAIDLELLQRQRDGGPCLDCITDDRALSVTGAPDLVARWGDLGRAMVDDGITGTDAVPMYWRGVPLGALNVFYRSPGPGADVVHHLLRAFADVATIAVAHSAVRTVAQVRSGLEDMLRARIVIEQAKGVLAYENAIDPGRAYAELVRRSRVDGATLGELAHGIVHRRGTTT